MDNYFTAKESRMYDQERIAYWIKGVEKREQANAREWNWTPILDYTQKSTQNGLNI